MARRPAGGALTIAWAAVSGPVWPDDLPDPPKGQTDPLVELRVIVANRLGRATESTSIIWDPVFARHFELVSSRPAAWRVRLDERGYGVLDTAGVLPGTDGTFRLWFRSLTGSVLEPEVIVAADGRIEVGRVRASWGVSETPAPAAGRLSRFIDDSGLSALVTVARWVPMDDRGAFRLATAISLTLGALTLAAAIGALWCAIRAQPWLDVVPEDE